jgi:integrase
MTGTTDRAAYGSGTIIESKKQLDGKTKHRWRVYAVERVTGLPRRKAGSTVGTLRDAKRDMEAARVEIINAGPVADQEMTIAGLMAAFLVAYADEVRPRTHQIAADLSRLYIVPQLGPMKIKTVTTPVLQRFHAELKRTTSLERTREQIQSVLSSAFNYAVRLGHLPYSPTGAVRVPKVKKTRVAPEHATLGALPAYDGPEAVKLLEVAMRAGTVHSYAVAFALCTGMRRGEVFGLKWSDFSDEGRWVRLTRGISDRLGGAIEGPLKTANSKRSLGLSPKTLEVLGAVRRLQAAQGHNRSWKWVFSATPDAMPQPGNVGRALESLVKQAKIRRLSFHGLRHTWCSNAYHDGMSIESISKYLGHNSVEFTRRSYLHIFEQVQTAPMLKSFGEKMSDVTIDPQSGNSEG